MKEPFQNHTKKRKKKKKALFRHWSSKVNQIQSCTKQKKMSKTDWYCSIVLLFKENEIYGHLAISD